MAKKSEQKSQVDKKIREYRLKNFLETVWMFLYIAIVILEILALFKVVHFGWGLLVFIIAQFIKLYLTKKSDKQPKTD